MKPYLRITLILILVLLPSCVSLTQSPPEVHHYSLEYEPPRFPGQPPLPVVLRIGEFEAAPVYETDRIIYRSRSYSAEPYAYHRWQARPARLVKTLLVRNLRQSSLFSAVVTEPGFPVAPLLEGTLNEFLEWDGLQHWEARLSLTVTLLAGDRPGARTVLLQKTYEERQPSLEKHPRGVAEAMSQAMARVSGQIIADLYQALSQVPTTPPRN